MQDLNKIHSLALQILTWAKSTLIVNLRFIDSAINALELKQYEGKMATNATYLFYDPLFILKTYKTEKNSINANYMHLILHSVFRHYKVEKIKEPKLWDLACDITVENLINELNIPCLEVKRQYNQKHILDELKENLGILNANKIYAYYQSQDLSDTELAKIHKYFYVDSHDLWYQKNMMYGTKIKTESKNIATKDSRTISANGLDGASQTRHGIDNNSENTTKTDEIWDKIAKKMQVDLETFSKSKGAESGAIIQNLRVLNRQKYNYSDFLKKFAVLGESLKLNDEEFDYIFYSYGLDLYGNVPLVEPLEYKEDYAIKEFVIAIDTSASVSGELVQKFLEKTYNILKQEESFHKKINLRILQCDASITEDVKITSRAEFDNYIRTMTLKGFGCTDFRPVFNHIDNLQKNKELQNLKGLIYFTDGYGTFPDNNPPYKTAFIFVDNDTNNNTTLPVWAIKLVLNEHDI